MASGHEEPQPHQAARTVEMGHAYETGQPGQPGIRWVARLTEFLRSTSTRTSGLQGRVLEGLGLTATQAAHSPALQAQNNIPSAQQQLQRPQHLAMMSPMMTTRMRAAAQAVGVGEAPAPPPPPPPPIYDRPLPPLPGPDPRTLFTPDQSERFRQHQREAPLLYQATDSTSSSEMQAEVNRRLQQYVRHYEGETEDLREQVQMLLRERELLRAYNGPQNLPSGDRAYNGPQNLPSGDRAYNERQNLPGGRAYNERQNLPGDRAYNERQNLPGDRAYNERQNPPGDRAQVETTSQQPSGQPRATPEYYSLPEGDRVLRDGQGRDAEDKGVSQADLMGLLAAGMRQLQDAQTKALERKLASEEPELVKPGVSTLPALKAPDPSTSPMEVQDWLQLLQAPMADLSDSSHDWWMQVQELASEGYRQWSNATPMERLAMKPPRNKALGKYARLNSRAASMLLTSLDETVRADLVARRSTQSASQIIYRVLTLYQPGGEAEKKLVLDQLQSPVRQETPAAAAKALREWERWYRRAADVGVATADPTVLSRALSTIMQAVLEGFPEAAFRTSLVRNSLRLDTRPTGENVIAFHRHLLAEAEALATGTKVTPSTTTPPQAPVTEARGTQGDKGARLKGLHAQGAPEPPVPKVKAPPPPTPPTAPSKQCKWFAKSEAGCRRGVDCQFQHDWGQTSKVGRCLVCSSTAHVKKDCPVKEKGSSKPTKPRSEQSSSTTSGSTPATRAVAGPGDPQQSPTQGQPAAEPSPTTSPSSRGRPGDQQGHAKQSR